MAKKIEEKRKVKILEREPEKVFKLPGISASAGFYRSAPRGMKSRHWKQAPPDDPQRKLLCRPLADDEELFYRIK